MHYINLGRITGHDEDVAGASDYRNPFGFAVLTQKGDYFKGDRGK
jgi:hypothetical protein